MLLPTFNFGRIQQLYSAAHENMNRAVELDPTNEKAQAGLKTIRTVEAIVNSLGR
jgi:hypothetical protein